jgi:uncharacterized membrane protein
MKIKNRLEGKLETSISYGLIAGVSISVLLEIAGLIVYFIQTGGVQVSSAGFIFIRGSDFFTFTYNLFRGSRSGSLAVFLMTAGLVVLILTPFARVIMSIIFFIAERNYRYVWITLFVLAVLAVSLAVH